MIRVRTHRDGAITCHVRRNWLLRWLGAEDKDMEVEWNGALWVGVDTGQPVTWRENAAIEKAVGR